MNANIPRKSLFNTEDRSFRSVYTGRDYHLSVWLPPSYHTSDNQYYPVIYLLDGDLLFGMAAGLTPLVLLGPKTTDVIVVGINYDIESYDQFFNLRELDFKIPEVQNEPPDSYADCFLLALTKEMIPFIEENYHADPSERCLYGYSSGGFFVLYALLTEPDTFHYYFCGSGDLYIAYPYIIEHDDKLRERTTNNPIMLYLTVGELEDFNLTPFNNLVSFFENAGYPGLTVKTEIYNGIGHSAEGLVLTYLRGISLVIQPIRSPE